MELWELFPSSPQLMQSDGTRAEIMFMDHVHANVLKIY